MKRLLGAFLAALTIIGVLSAVFVGVAAAQDVPTINPVPQTDTEAQGSEMIDFDKNQAEIDRTRRVLVGIAVVLTLGLAMYWWHTMPSRRLRIASKRLATQQNRRSAAPTRNRLISEK